MAKVYLSRLAEEQLGKLSLSDKGSVSRKLLLLTQFPRAGVRLHDEWEGCRVIYSEQHRIVYYLPEEDEAEVLYIRPSKLG